MQAVLLPRDLERLRGVHPDLVRVVHRAREIVSFIVVEGVRTRERQAALFKAGLSRTMNSRHLTGHAVDLAPWRDDGDGLPEAGEIGWTLQEMLPVVEAMRAAAAELRVPVVHGHDWGWDSPHHDLDRKFYP